MAIQKSFIRLINLLLAALLTLLGFSKCTELKLNMVYQMPIIL